MGSRFRVHFGSEATAWEFDRISFEGCKSPARLIFALEWLVVDLGSEMSGIKMACRVDKTWWDVSLNSFTQTFTTVIHIMSYYYCKNTESRDQQMNCIQAEHNLIDNPFLGKFNNSV